MWGLRAPFSSSLSLRQYVSGQGESLHLMGCPRKGRETTGGALFQVVAV